MQHRKERRQRRRSRVPRAARCPGRSQDHPASARRRRMRCRPRLPAAPQSVTSAVVAGDPVDDPGLRDQLRDRAGLSPGWPRRSIAPTPPWSAQATDRQRHEKQRPGERRARRLCRARRGRADRAGSETRRCRAPRRARARQGSRTPGGNVPPCASRSLPGLPRLRRSRRSAADEPVAAAEIQTDAAPMRPAPAGIAGRRRPSRRACRRAAAAASMRTAAAIDGRRSGRCPGSSSPIMPATESCGDEHREKGGGDDDAGNAPRRARRRSAPPGNRRAIALAPRRR